jgi:predicted phosphodiesterase
MARFHLLSDLHLDHHPYTYTPPSQDIDFIVLAGDISSLIGAGPPRFREFLKSVCSRGLPVIFVPGNHDYYGSKIGIDLAVFSDLRSMFSSLIVLDCESRNICGVTISGATLWTDFSYGADEGAGMRAQFTISDFSQIENQGKPLSFQLMAKKSEQAQKFLRNASASSNIIVTHFLPHPLSIHRQFEKSLINSYFTVDLSGIMSQFHGVWVHGHTHCSADYRLRDCRVICNPRGYRNENLEFKKHLVIDTENPMASAMP